VTRCAGDKRPIRNIRNPLGAGARPASIPFPFPQAVVSIHDEFVPTCKKAKAVKVHPLTDGIILK